MKALKKFTEQSKAIFKLVDEPMPQILNDDDVKIEIKSIGICTSDIHVLHGAMKMPDGNIVGHEYSGIVVETGKGVKNLAPGDAVVGELAKGACMKCRICKTGHYELCPSKRPPGWVSQGIYTQYTVQPLFCIHKLPLNIDMNVAAMAEPIAICVYGCMERAQISKDDLTVIYGMGSIGLFTLIALLDYGVKNIICISPTRNGRHRLELAKELGAHHIFSTDENIQEKIKELSEGWMADCVIDCSGSPSAINQGLDLLRKDGKFVALGIASGDTIPFNYNKAVLKVLRLTFSATSSHEAWNQTIGILERNQEKIKKVVSHQFPLSEWEKAYQALENREAIKAVLTNG